MDYTQPINLFKLQYQLENVMKNGDGSEQGYVYLLASSSSLFVICSSVDLKHLSIY